MIPLKEQLSDMRLEAFKERMNLTGAFDVDLPYERMMSLIRENGLEVIDPRESMAAIEGELEKEGKSLYYEDDAHFDPAGQRAFGEMIYERIWG